MARGMEAMTRDMEAMASITFRKKHQASTSWRSVLKHCNGTWAVTRGNCLHSLCEVSGLELVDDTPFGGTKPHYLDTYEVTLPHS